VGRTARYERGGRAVTLIAEKDRKMMKMVLKNLLPGQSVKQRLIPADVISKYRQKITDVEQQLHRVMADERDEKEVCFMGIILICV
jgi:ATP-dependent RNA helicase DDX27